MSYTRDYHEIVSKTVSKTVSVSYPASQNGGSTSVTVSILAEIPVDVNIHVDTNPFDHSVQHCGENVNLLTAAVVATETAEVLSIEKNSYKVADTIVGGFFSYIRSEISQQISELSQNVEAQLMHLKELANSCLAKKKQMEADFNRIAGRYMKIFDDLNSELSNRIYELDKPTFTFRKETDSQKIRTSNNDLVSTVAIFGSESSDLQSKIGASIAKKRALDSINKSKMYLWQQKKLNETVRKCMLNESVSRFIFVPVCLIESNSLGNPTDRNIFTNDYLSFLSEKSKRTELFEYFSSDSLNWDYLSPEDNENIRLYFNSELNSRSSQNDLHSERVRDMILKIAKISSIKSISF